MVEDEKVALPKTLIWLEESIKVEEVWKIALLEAEMKEL